MITPTFKLEHRLWSEGYHYVAGLDEVGRGALAGPVVAAAVIFACPPRKNLPGLFPNPKGWGIGGLRDSKLLSPAQRDKLDPLIKKHSIAWAIGVASRQVIDKIGISGATEQAMLKALSCLTDKPDFYLIDYFRLKGLPMKQQLGVVDGDTLVASIAAASVIAKVYRDGLMVHYHQTYPQYGFDRHKGYGTPSHLTILRRLGPCPLHRLSFIA